MCLRNVSYTNMATVPLRSPNGDNLSREAMAVYLQDNSQKIGGPDKTVEIDESKFGKREYYRGHRVQGQWIFGGVERGMVDRSSCPLETEAMQL